MNGLSFLNFLIWATDTDISEEKKKGFWDQLNGLGTSWMGWGPVDWSSQKQNSKIDGLCFLNFFYLSDCYWPEIGNPKVWPTYGLTNGWTYQLTWVGARDTCVSKKGTTNACSTTYCYLLLTICLRCCPRHAPDDLIIRCGFPHDSPEISLRFRHNFPKISPRFPQVVTVLFISFHTVIHPIPIHL